MSTASRIRRLARYWRSLLLVAVILASLVSLAFEPVSMERLLELGEKLARDPLAVTVIVVVMAVLFALALPGSLVFWLLAPFQPPLISVPLLLLGGLGGAVGAYGIGFRLGRDWRAGTEQPRLVKLLEQRGDAPTQFALRVLPGFPHSVINYGAGALHLPLPGFVLAAATGLGVKWGVYASAVYGAVEALERGEGLTPAAMAPLLIVAMLVFTGVAVRARLLR